MVPDELIGNLGDVHLYNNHIEPIQEQLNREPYKLPKLKFSDWFENSILEKHHENDFDEWIESIKQEDFIIEEYESHPTIKLPLSN